MCTVVVSFAPEEPVPVLVVGVRDEFADRPWRPPDWHWPGLPVVGGLDLQAGGTWLAVNASIPRAACVLNGWGGEPVPASRRRSRGELPLQAASEGVDAVHKVLSDATTLERYDPFHLIVAEIADVSVLSWDGTGLSATALPPGTHLHTNAGHAYPAPAAAPGAAGLALAGPDGDPPDGAGPAERRRAAVGVAAERRRWREPRAAYFGPRFAAEPRPPGRPGLSLSGAWDGWLGLVDGDGLEVTDPRALIVRRELPDGRIWGSSSVSLVSLVRDGAEDVRYDFRAVPAGTPADKARGDHTGPDETGAGATGRTSGDFAWRAVLP